jgi:hypothetical protein
LTSCWDDGETSSARVGPAHIELGPRGWTASLFPLLFAGRDGDERHAVLFPLLWHFADPARSTTVVGPAYHHSGPDGWSAGLAPLWFSGRSADGSAYDVAPPLLWRFGGPDGERLALLPLFDYSRDATRTRLVSPLFYHSADADQVEDARSSTIVLGLYWDLRRPDLRARVAFPLWWQVEDPTTGDGLTTLFPLFWRRDHGTERTSIFLNAAWTSGTTPEGPTWSFHLVPVVDVGSDAPDHLRWQVLGGLLGHERRGARGRWRVGFVWTDPTPG